MAAELSFTKRAAAELSRCFNGLNVGTKSSSNNNNNNSSSASNSSCNSGNSNVNESNHKRSTSIKQQNNGQLTSGEQDKRNINSSANDTQTKSGGFFTLANSVRSIGSAYERNILAAKNAAQSGFRLASGSSSSTTSAAVVATDWPATDIATSTIKPLSSTSATLQTETPPTPRKQPPKAPPKTIRARRRNFLLGLSMQVPKTTDEIWNDEKVMNLILSQCKPADQLKLVQVCKLWKDVLYEQQHCWTQFNARIDFTQLRRETTNKQRAELLRSLPSRLFDSISVHGAQDEELLELVTALGTFGSLRSLALRCCGCGDTALQQLLSNFGGRLHRLELVSCNELSDGAHWSAMCPQLRQLLIADCINVADETIAAIGQTLPRLVELSVQAYHVSDQCFQYLRSSGGSTVGSGAGSGNSSLDDTDSWSSSAGNVGNALRVLRLNNCWELSNQAVLQVAHCLPQLRHLSLSGCSKITDEAVELIAEQMRCLHHLDLSWCGRISDAALEYIACDLADTLTELVLDRCSNITDIGLGYVTTMSNLEVLSIRWCVQVRDFGVQTLCTMPNLRRLSLAGCSMITPNALGCLKQLKALEELELTNCPAASPELVVYLQQQFSHKCSIVK